MASEAGLVLKSNAELNKSDRRPYLTNQTH